MDPEKQHWRPCKEKKIFFAVDQKILSPNVNKDFQNSEIISLVF